jgi:hypothetical protein
MYLKSLQIERFRAFRYTEVAFRYPGAAASGKLKYPNINLLLGNNGMGKSAALKAAALAFMSPVLASTGYRPYSLVRREVGKSPMDAAVKAHVSLSAQDREGDDSPVPDTRILIARVSRVRTTERLEFDPELATPVWDPMFSEDSATFFFVGYGVSRTVESPAKVDSSLRRRLRHIRYERVAGLFEEQVTLMPLAGWLPALQATNPMRYQEVRALLNELLPEGTDFLGKMLNGDYTFNHRELSVSFSALSDGFRAYIGWIGDLLYHMCQCCPAGTNLVDHRGIVMIDEVDLHLHPQWQLEVLPTVSRTFPRLQFLCTTHSPIVAGTVESANLLLLLAEGETASRLATPDLEVHGLTADQILTSSHFGLVSTRAPDFYEELQRVSGDVSRGKPGAATRFMEMTSLGAGAASAEGE